jgi:hypothetical protein
MSIAREIATSAATPDEAAAAIRSRMAVLTPDLVPGSDAYIRQVELLSAAVASIWREMGRATATTPNATAIERRASRGGAREGSGPPLATRTLHRAIDTLERRLTQAQRHPLPQHEAAALYRRIDQLSARFEELMRS